MSNLRKPLVVAVLALLAVLTVDGTVLAALVGRNGRAVTAVRTVTNDVEWRTASADWVDVPDMKVSVSVPADQKAILVITFSTASRCALSLDAAHNTCAIRVLLDGNVVSPGEVIWTHVERREGDTSVRSMQWIAGPVAAGEHIVKVQAQMEPPAVVLPPGSFTLVGRTLTVLRSKI